MLQTQEMKIKNRFFMIFVALCAMGALCGCAQLSMQLRSDPFPYKDLTEEAYIKNAEAYWEDLTAYLDTTDEEDVSRALKAFNEKRGEPTQDTIMAMDMLTRYQAYLLEKSGETLASLDAMSVEEREDFGKDIQQKVEDDMPNAWKMQQDSMQKEKDDLGIIGVYNFKGQQKITAYKNGTFTAVPIN